LAGFLKIAQIPQGDELDQGIANDGRFSLPDEFIGPKEEAILDLCRQEKAHGRHVLLLCQQTDTLDIQPEWKARLEAAGLKTAILRAAPNQREGWVEKQVKDGVDVVISHPRKVATGIDLLDFPTIVWMAIDYSVYTVLQASRRSWRIGQTRPVKVYYFCYEETIQEDALRLVAAKVAAALRVNGGTVANDSLADLDELASGDLVATLADPFPGRFNGRGVDLNRNWDCLWSPSAYWRDQSIDPGDYAFSEPESVALRDFILRRAPAAVVFWHSAANYVFASGCGGTWQPSRELAERYAAAAGYETRAYWTAYPITGDAADYLASRRIPAISVELSTHESLDWEQNLAGVLALLEHYGGEEETLPEVPEPPGG
jgi:hypothetical protein